MAPAVRCDGAGNCDTRLQELLERAASGDSIARANLLDELRPRVLSSCRRILRDPHEAEDATQETLHRINGSVAEIQSGRVLSFAFRVARNVCIDRIRARKKTVALPNEIPAPDQALDDSMPFSREALLRALRTIAELVDRDIVLFKVLEEHTYSEIARLLGEKPRWVKDRWERVIKPQLSAALETDRGAL